MEFMDIFLLTLPAFKNKNIMINMHSCKWCPTIKHYFIYLFYLYHIFNAWLNFKVILINEP